ncbi:hypothetical protein DBR45_09105 [Pseudomonas sp. HMWF031]|nr:hypothetical protein DBR45_09105 [Pseudomonas sp. HMWF031]
MPLWERACSRRGVDIQRLNWLPLRLREQARSCRYYEISPAASASGADPARACECDRRSGHPVHCSS